MFKTEANVYVTFTETRRGLPGTNAAMILSPGPYCVGDAHDVITEEIPAKQCVTPLLILKEIPQDAKLHIARARSGSVIAKVFTPSGSCILEWVFPEPNEFPEHMLYRQVLRHSS